MRAEIVLNERDFVRIGKKRVGQILERMGVIDGRPAVGDFHVTPAFQRREHHEQIGHAIAFVFVVVTRRLSRSCGDRRARLFDELLVRRESWRCLAGGSPVRVSRSGRPVVSVAGSSATAAAKRTQQSRGVGY